MRMIYCTGNIEMLDEFQELLDKNEVQNYQIIDRVLAQSENSVPRLDTATWPGYNFSIFIQIDNDNRAKKIMQKIEKFNANLRRDSNLITFYSWEIGKFGLD